ncbi:MAG: hypothetical protein HKN23_17835 [Verrucomicrobiales bacterium]|nr:hypothetical protein [Verrucomicrobiales bacterium]
MAKQTESEGFQWLEVDLSDVRFLVRKHLRLLILAPILGFVLAALASFLVKPVFTANATVFIRPNFDQDFQLEGASSKLEDDDSLRSMQETLVSDTIVLGMVDRLGLRNDPDFLGEGVDPEPLSDAALLRKIRDRYSTDLVPTTRLVELTVRDFSAERAPEIARTLIDEFLVHLRDDRNDKEIELRQTLLLQARKALAEALEAERKLENFRSENPGLFVEQDSSVFQERLLQQGSALNEANAEVSRLAGMLSALSEIDPESEPIRVFQILSNRNSEYLSELMTMRASAKADLAVARKRFTVRHPDYLDAANRLDEVEATLRVYAGEMKSSVQSEYAAAKQKAEKLNETLTALQGDLVGVKFGSAEFRGLKDEIDRTWNTHSRLQQKIMDLDLDPEVKPTFATVMNKPVVPDRKSSPRRSFWAVGGTILGGLTALGWILFRHRKGLPFTSNEQVADLLNLPPVAEIEVPVEGDFAYRSARVEQSQGMLNLLLSLRDARVIQVASIHASTGAGVLAWVIAKLSALRGSQSLLISFSYQAITNPQIQPSGNPNLSVLELPASLLLDPESFRRGLTTTLADHDRVFIDTTRLSESQARLTIAGLAQKTIIAVAEEGPSTRGEFESYLRQCVSAGIFSNSVVYLREAAPPRLKMEPPKVLSLPKLRHRNLRPNSKRGRKIRAAS